jgi:rhodanese-related sulfurtransferase
VGLDDLLATAEGKISRLTPADAQAAAADGALIVDIRDDGARERDGIVPGSVHVPRTVLEWRLEPGGKWRNPSIEGDRWIIVLCEHGFSSTLAAASLVDLGYARVGDVSGGFEAWSAAGLPVARALPRPPETLPGMGGPDR